MMDNGFPNETPTWRQAYLAALAGAMAAGLTTDGAVRNAIDAATETDAAMTNREQARTNAAKARYAAEVARVLAQRTYVCHESPAGDDSTAPPVPVVYTVVDVDVGTRRVTLRHPNGTTCFVDSVWELSDCGFEPTADAATTHP